MRVPRLHIVIDYIFLLAIAFSDIDEGIVESIAVPTLTLPFESQYATAAMPRTGRRVLPQ